MTDTIRVDAALYGALYSLYVEARESALDGTRHDKPARDRITRAVKRVRDALDDDLARSVARFDRSRCSPR